MREQTSRMVKYNYEDFFGLNRNPFHLSPDPYFRISSQQSNDALASIAHAIRQRSGFVVLTGEVGTGKTLILRCLSELWKREEIRFAYFIGVRLSTVDLLSYISSELGIRVVEPTKGNLLRALHEFLRAQFEKGSTTVLIIDEAHLLRRSVLEEIGLLTNFETADQKLIQIVLVGQPELDKKLELVEMRSLKQRIAVRCRLEPLPEEEIRHYIEHRLELAGAGSEAATIFPNETVKAICRYSQGIPRLINSICHQTLMAACARQLRVVPVEIIQGVSSNLGLAPTALASEVISLPDYQHPTGQAERLAADQQESVHSDEVLNGSSSSQAFRHRLRPWLRLVFIIGVAVIVPSLLSTDFVASHRKSATLLRQFMSLGENVPAALVDTSLQRAGEDSSVQLDFGSGRAGVRRADVGNLRSPGAPEHASPRRKVVPDTLAKRVVESQPLPTAIGPPATGSTQPKTSNYGQGLVDTSAPAPSSAGANADSDLQTKPDMQTKETDPGTDLLSSPLTAPTPPVANTGSLLQPAKLVWSPPPSYPAVARMGNIGGPVIIDAVVDEKGEVGNMVVISGNPVLRATAIEGLRRWKYEPALLNGQPTKTHIRVRIDFKP